MSLSTVNDLNDIMLEILLRYMPDGIVLDAETQFLVDLERSFVSRPLIGRSSVKITQAVEPTASFAKIAFKHKKKDNNVRRM